MRIVYNLNTKYVEQVSISVHGTKCKSICAYHEETHTENCPECANCFEVPDDESVLEERELYKVDDTDPDNKILVREPKCRFIWECSETVEDSNAYPLRYSKPANGSVVNFTLRFKDQDGQDISPIGTLKLKCGRGALSMVTKVLTGTETFVSFTWTSVQETTEVKFKARMVDWPIMKYDQFKLVQASVTLTPVP